MSTFPILSGRYRDMLSVSLHALEQLSLMLLFGLETEVKINSMS